jgi:hydrogenase nickel incorporation protein HypB
MCASCGCEARGTGDGEADGHGHDHGHGEHHHPHHPHDHHHPHTRALRIEEAILAKNDRIARANRAWLAERSIVALNVMSSPGAGKTTLLECTIRTLGAGVALSVIEGDQETERDAERIRATGAPVVQVNTGAGCHLDAEMVAKALRQLDPRPRSLLLVENVGNLVCPALFDLGERAKVLVTSVTEGEDKPLKYPHMFRAAEVVVLNKTDLLPHVEFDTMAWRDNLHRVNPRLRVFSVSARRGDGIDAWCSFLRGAAT